MTDYQRTGQKTTDQLRPGDRVQLPSGLVRTVAEVGPSGWLNSRNEPILTVRYAEGKTPEWSAGNSTTAGADWTVLLDWYAQGGFCPCFDGQVSLHDGHCCLTAPDNQCRQHDADITAWLTGQTDWPRTAEDGSTVWACCLSTVGAPCQHRTAVA